MFLTLAQSIRRDAHEHMKRAGKYASDGNFQNADGSAEKAARKFRQANALEIPPLPPVLQCLLMEIENKLLDGID